MIVVTYTLIIKPTDSLVSCKRKHLHGASSDSEAVEMAEEYAKNKKATIYQLKKTIQEDVILIMNN